MDNKHIEDLNNLVSEYLKEIEDENTKPENLDFLSLINDHLRETNKLSNSFEPTNIPESDEKVINTGDLENSNTNLTLTDFKSSSTNQDSPKKEPDLLPENNINPVNYDIQIPHLESLKQPEDKIIKKIVTYEKLPSKLWAKITGLVLVCSLCSGVLGGYIADNFNKEKVVVEKEIQTQPSTINHPSHSLEDVIDVARKSSVEINSTVTSQDVFGRKYSSKMAGSGVIINEEGYVITNNHVVENASELEVTDYLGNVFSAEIVGTDGRSDIAVIKINSDQKLDSVIIGDSSNIRIGQNVIVVGNPLGTLGGSVTSGIVSALNRDIYLDGQYQTLIQTDATINSGNSGGGLFDTNGSLIGIINAKDSGFTSNGTIIEGIGFAIPVNKAMDIAEQLIAYGSVNDRATLGVKVSETVLENGKTGLFIAEIIEDSSAANSDLQVGDKIVSVNGTDINSFLELYKIIDNSKIGDVLEITVERNSEVIEITVELVNSIVNT